MTASTGAPAPPRKRGDWLYGKTITPDGSVRFLSVSQLSTADPEEEGCLRRWYYNVVAGRRPPPKRAQERGTDAHAQIERYLRTGEKDLSALVLSGFHMIPKPGPDLLIEHDVVLRPDDPHPTDEASAAAALARVPLRVDGIPFLGKLDLTHGRGENQGAEDINEAFDPPGTVEVCDWKTTGDAKWIKPARALPRLIQMAGYGEWVKAVEPDVQHLRLSHGYFVEAGGRSRKVSLRVLPEEIEPTWARATAIAKQIRHAAVEHEADRIDANTKACGAFGGCYHRDVCSAGMHRALAGFVGIEAADRILRRGASDPGASAPPSPSPPIEGVSMSLLDTIKARAGGQPAAPQNTAAQAPAPPPPSPGISAILKRTAPPAAPPGPPPGPSAEEIARAAAELAREEAELKGQRQAADLVTAIEAYGLGRPALAGEAARLYGIAVGRPAHGAQIAGPGELGEKILISKIEELQTLAAELAAAATAGQIPAPGAASPPVNDNPVLPPDAPIETASAAAPSAPVEPPKKAARKKPEAPPSVPDPAAGTFDAPELATNVITLFVNCIAEGVATESLWPWIEALCADARKELGVVDLQAAPDSSAAAFGKWKGLIAAGVREYKLPPGAYTLDTRGSDLAEVIAEAMRAKVRASGGLYVRGFR